LKNKIALLLMGTIIGAGTYTIAKSYIKNKKPHKKEEEK
jgi:hypothetical protein